MNHTTRAFTRLKYLRSRPYSTTTPKQSRTPLLLIAIIASTTTYYYLTPSPPATLNTETFTPYTITARTPISPTSFILTTVSNNPSSPSTYLSNSPSSFSSSSSSSSSSRWRFPLWSVEFKQPEVQIARHYTPLPGGNPNELRFYIRTLNSGEMSAYLNRLREGKELFLRGPHPGFEVERRLGSQRQVVFLAGGTGVVPGLQVARAVLDREDTRFTLLWAVRKREEVQSVTTKKSWWQSLWGGICEVEVIEKPSPIGSEIQALKTQYGDRFKIHVAVDEEKTAFNSREVQSTLAPTPHTDENKACQLHSQKQHAVLSEFEEKRKSCVCDPSTPRGKNLFFVSGPEGFVSHFAGAKTWLNGMETQGPVGGILGRLQQNNSSFARDWLVLKL